MRAPSFVVRHSSFVIRCFAPGEKNRVLDAYPMKVEMPLVATVILYLLAALLVSVFARWIARGLLMVSRMLPSQRAITVHRRQTLEGLIGSLISLLAFMVAGLAAVALFVRPETLIWIVGPVQRGIWPGCARSGGRCPGRRPLPLPQHVRHRRKGRAGRRRHHGGRNRRGGERHQHPGAFAERRAIRGAQRRHQRHPQLQPGAVLVDQDPV